jgi:hypothetical protein
MAATLKRLKVQNVGISLTDLTTGTETGPAVSKVWNIPRLYITNIHASATPTVTVTHVTSAVSTNLPPFTLGVRRSSTGAYILENIVLLNGDKLQIVSDVAASLDVFGSIMEEDA